MLIVNAFQIFWDVGEFYITNYINNNTIYYMQQKMFGGKSISWKYTMYIFIYIMLYKSVKYKNNLILALSNRYYMWKQLNESNNEILQYTIFLHLV